jgi:hypothetical protein
MRLTSSMLRELAFSPSVLAKKLAAPASSTFGNPQRSWLEGAWREYFAGGRNPATFRDGLARRIRASQARLKESYAPAARDLGNRFLDWDHQESSTPVVVFPRNEDVPWKTHTFAFGLHLVYMTPQGYLLRYLWTDHASNLRNPDIALVVAGAMLYADGVLGVNRVQQIEIWQLRHGERHNWPRQQAEASMADFTARLQWLEGTLG